MNSYLTLGTWIRDRGRLTPDRVADAIWDAVARPDADWSSEVAYDG